MTRISITVVVLLPRGGVGQSGARYGGSSGEHLAGHGLRRARTRRRRRCGPPRSGRGCARFDAREMAVVPSRCSCSSAAGRAPTPRVRGGRCASTGRRARRRQRSASAHSSSGSDMPSAYPATPARASPPEVGERRASRRRAGPAPRAADGRARAGRRRAGARRPSAGVADAVFGAVRVPDPARISTVDVAIGRAAFGMARVASVAARPVRRSWRAPLPRVVAGVFDGGGEVADEVVDGGRRRRWRRGRSRRGRRTHGAAGREAAHLHRDEKGDAQDARTRETDMVMASAFRCGQRVPSR